MFIYPKKHQFLALLGISFILNGCAPIPILLPIERLGTYFYDAKSKTLLIQAYGSSSKLNPAKIYAYTITATKRGSHEYILSGFVEEDSGAQPFRGSLGLARSQNLLLTDVAPGIYRFVDGSTDKVVGTIETSAPPPPFTDPV